MSKVTIELTKEQAEVLQAYLDNKVDDLKENLRYKDYGDDLELKEEWESDIVSLQAVLNQI